MPSRPLLISVAATLASAHLAFAAEPAGKELYNTHCAACHGPNGGGDGPAAVWLYPKPRNFSSGLFKIKSTPTGSLPSDDDLFETITRGMPGSSMPSFTYLTEQERQALVPYVKSLTARTDASGHRSNYFEEAKAKNQLAPSIHVPAEPPVTVPGLAEGKRVYTKLQCFACHGETGQGTGPSAPTLKDVWGFSLPPRDFNTGPFRGGHTGRDLFLRIATGLAGTPMPAFGNDQISDEERWSLVHYIQSLRRKDIEINDILQSTDGIIHGTKVTKLPLDPADPIWETMDPARVPLNPLWPQPEPVAAVAVRVVHDGKRIAILCQWRDAILNGAPVRIQDFQDAVALQFSLKGTTPFLGMGDAKNPVNIWQWKAGWQQEAAGQRPDMDTVYAAMYSDTYPETKPLFRTAEAAGNLLAQPAHASPIEDANASGFGTLASQPPARQNVKGRGFWRDGSWSVVFVRDLKSRDAADVRIEPGKSTPIAFAVWDGQYRDRNGKKFISNWHRLEMEK